MREKIWIGLVYLLLLAGLVAGFRFYGSESRYPMKASDHTMSVHYPPGRYRVKPPPPLPDLRLGSTVVYYPPDTRGKAEEKRLAFVVGVAGDHVKLVDRRLFVNGQEEALGEKLDVGSVQIAEILVPDGCVFLLTARPDRAEDSFKHGPLSYRLVEGVLD